jgi:hypothetical protein
LSKPVVVYGASGYTGQLVCEHLRNYNIPFIAAGRNAKRLEEQMQRVPGIETAEYDVVEVKHDVESLADLMDGAKVVCNTVGPFVKFGSVVIEAALKSGCHYMDSGGEQGFIKNMAEEFGEQYAEKGLCLLPSTAYMFTSLDICSRLCKEHLPGVNALDGLLMPIGVPTYASTQTFFDMVRRTALYLELNELKEWPAATAYETQMPGYHATGLSLPWGGTTLPLYYLNDPDVHTCKVLGGFNNRVLMETVLATFKKYVEEIKPLPEAEQEAAISKMAEGWQPGTPPRENPMVHTGLDSCYGHSSLETVHVVMKSILPYRSTGMYHAHVANYLLNGGQIKKYGFASTCEAVGYRTLLEALKNHGYVKDVKISFVA